MTGKPFELPEDPGVHPTQPAGATAAQIAEVTRQHNADTKTWTECINTDTALINQIIATFEPKYLRSLHNKYTGYANNTTAMKMLNHLYEKYGKITAADLLSNEEKLHQPYNPAEPIETLFDHSPVRDIWLKAMSTEIGRLAQGVPGQTGQGTHTIGSIPPLTHPNRKIRHLCQNRIRHPPSTKEDPNRIRITVGGNLLHYDHDTGTPSADLTTTKLFLNSVISANDARFITLDVKDFYLNTPMPEYEYMKILLRLLPEEVITHYKLRDLAEGGEYAYMQIQKGMYGLKQAGRIAYDQLVTHLAKYGYRPTTTQGLWKHDTRNISFILVVDDFGLKYTNEHDAQHLIQALQDLYRVNVNWSGSLYCGLTLQWNYAQKYVDISMPGYIQKVLTKFQHPPPSRKQDAPALWNQPTYGQRIQYAVDD
jgi:Reverse transcriptase (RNA-dependent DNA polymerase).